MRDQGHLRTQGRHYCQLISCHLSYDDGRLEVYELVLQTDCSVDQEACLIPRIDHVSVGNNPLEACPKWITVPQD